MSFKIVTPIATEPLLAAAAKLHCKIDTTADDSLIAVWITAAREYAEHYTGRAFAAQTLEMALPCFPCDYIDLDLPPVASVTSIKYTDTAGVEQTVSSANYTLSAYGDSRRINRAYAYYWPITQQIANAVRIQYVTGYTTLPKAAYSALLLLVGYLNENRQAELAPGLVPGADSLLNTIKLWGR